MGKIYSIINKVKAVIGKVLAPVRAKYGKFISRNREGTLKMFGFTLKDK